ncbi:doublecortin domain-containing protein 2-like [Lingula anatina]|uniref:Doublecortin domain-containing protein 2-like n=1 Tax=Lingula anatina TaxID=7574 RepID=A0A1S3JHQ2_LINAN|nr:doublecortin domain-containing protein 2-like [Lingula anatina]|eukprot:XP_013409917.1 doublecortin domain-containing protein 2-like [Lingula anatina]
MSTFGPRRVPNPAKWITVYRNNDDYFPGAPVSVDETKIRTFETFLDRVTVATKNKTCVRGMRTLSGRRIIGRLEDIENRGKYVAITNGAFRAPHPEKLENRSQSKGASPADFNIKIHKRTIPHSGRYRKVNTKPLKIFVFPNGDVLKKAMKVTLTPIMQQDMYRVLEEVGKHVWIRTGCVRKLVDLETQKAIYTPKLLKENKEYVAVGSEGYNPLDYKADKPRMDTSTKIVSKPWEQSFVGRKKKHGSKNHSRSSSMNDSTKSNSSGEKNKSMSPRRPLPPIQQNQQRQPHPPAQKRDEDSVFHARPVKHKRSPDKPREIDYDEDKSGMFKSKQQSNVTRGATEVEETLDTKVDLPIDQVEPEEVKEEEIVTEDKEVPDDKNLTKSPSDPNQESISEEKDAGRGRLSSAEEKEQKAGFEERKETDNTQEVKEQGENTDQDDDLEKQTAAATTIQAGFRGYKARKHVADLKDGATTNNNNNDSSEDDNIPQSDNSDQNVEDNSDKETEAATKIQAGFRGYRDRKRVAELKGDSQDIDKMGGRETFTKETSDPDDKAESAENEADKDETEAAGHHDNEEDRNSQNEDGSSTYRVDETQDDKIDDLDNNEAAASLDNGAAPGDEGLESETDVTHKDEPTVHEQNKAHDDLKDDTVVVEDLDKAVTPSQEKPPSRRELSSSRRRDSANQTEPDTNRTDQTETSNNNDTVDGDGQNES